MVQVHLNARQNDLKNFSGRIKLDFMRQHDMIRKQKKNNDRQYWDHSTNFVIQLQWISLVNIATYQKRNFRLFFMRSQNRWRYLFHNSKNNINNNIYSISNNNHSPFIVRTRRPVKLMLMMMMMRAHDFRGPTCGQDGVGSLGQASKYLVLQLVPASEVEVPLSEEIAVWESIKEELIIGRENGDL